MIGGVPYGGRQGDYAYGRRDRGEPDRRPRPADAGGRGRARLPLVQTRGRRRLVGATRIGDIAYEVATRTEVVSLLVEDADIIEARRLLWERHRLVVEHGTAAAFAALHTGGYRPDSGERVAVVLCGANTDPFDL